MRIIPLFLVAGLSSALLLPGCGQEPSQASRAALDSALEQIERAEQGYLPQDAAAEMTLEDYRVQTLQGALSDLDTAIQQGGPAEAVVASRLKASILLTQARSQARDAAAAYGDVGARAGSIVRYLDAITRATARIRVLDQGGDVPLQQLQTTRQEQQRQQQQTQVALGELQQNVQTLETQQQQLKQEAGQLAQQAQQLRQQAFVAEGDQRFDLDQQAATSQLEAQRVQIKSDEIETQLHQLRSQLRLVQAEQQLLTASVQTLDEMIQGTQQGQQAGAENLAQAQADRQAAAEQLLEAFAEVQQQYQTRVQAGFEQASAAAQQAVAAMESAVTKAQTSEQRTDAQRGLLEALSTRASVLADQAMAAGGFGSSVAVLAQHAETLAPTAASQFRQTYQQIRSNQQQVVAAASTVLQEAQQVAQNLPGDQAQPLRDSLAWYQQQISQATLE